MVFEIPWKLGWVVKSNYLVPVSDFEFFQRFIYVYISLNYVCETKQNVNQTFLTTEIVKDFHVSAKTSTQRGRKVTFLKNQGNNLNSDSKSTFIPFFLESFSQTRCVNTSKIRVRDQWSICLGFIWFASWYKSSKLLKQSCIPHTHTEGQCDSIPFKHSNYETYFVGFLEVF